LNLVIFDGATSASADWEYEHGKTKTLMSSSICDAMTFPITNPLRTEAGCRRLSLSGAGDQNILVIESPTGSGTFKRTKMSCWIGDAPLHA